MEAASTLPRSRSRSRAALTSFQKLLSAVKSFHNNSSATPSTLQRSGSKRLLERLLRNKTKRSDNKLSGEVRSSKIMVVTVRVKDILRWKSFRVVEEEEEVEAHHLDDNVVGPANDAPTNSNSNDGSEVSWGESEFTAVEAAAEDEELPCCMGDSGDEDGKNWDDVGVDGASDSEVGSKEDKLNIGSEEGTEQQSPISVLNSPFRDEVSEEDLPLSFDQKMANMERTKQRLLQSIQWFEDLAGVHDDGETDSIEEEEDEQPIEVKSKANSSKGFCWFKRGNESLMEKKECMEKLGQWNKFEEEKTELGVELEDEVLSDLLDEILSDFCGCNE
uniref:Uncharacterized protein n=2 Tax=Chenopodium quinoa TaxID=63459 RepID=A0A803MQ18_CHEQI